MPASKKEAKEFVKRWKKRLSAIPAGSNNEQQDTQKFWVDLLINVLGIPSNTIDSFVDFERKVRGRRIDFGGDEEKIVAHLFNLYAEKVGESK